MAGLMVWLESRWQDTLVPLAVFFFVVVLLLWVRRWLGGRLLRWAEHTSWPGDEMLLQALCLPSLLWAVLLGIYAGAQSSQIPPELKQPIGRGLLTLLVISTVYFMARVSAGLSTLYAAHWRGAERALHLASNLIISVVVLIALLVVANLWGVSAAPLWAAVGVVGVVAVVGLRDTLPNVVASLHIGAAGHLKPGDYIRLDTGEEGQVTDVGWGHTRLRALDGATLVIPNAKLARTTVVNYGKPVKKARDPFRFFSRSHLTRLTGLKARTLRQLMDALKKAPDSVVYYHTHHFIEEHQYLTPEPANDFAVWVGAALGDRVLSEKLAVVDAFEFPTLDALRDQLVAIMEQHLVSVAEERVAPEGQELHFAASVSFIVPTSYAAHDLREFVEVVTKLPPSSLYFHAFESRLRLERDTNDFSAWIADSLDDPGLAADIGRLDPYNYTLEGLRSSLVQLVEKRIQ